MTFGGFIASDKTVFVTVSPFVLRCPWSVHELPLLNTLTLRTVRVWSCGLFNPWSNEPGCLSCFRREELNSGPERVNSSGEDLNGFELRMLGVPVAFQRGSTALYGSLASLHVQHDAAQPDLQYFIQRSRMRDGTTEVVES